ncbi:MAG: hypothetical protein RL497_750 [Pseudomonadota bacterium]|jgi:hypothetical protein
MRQFARHAIMLCVFISLKLSAATPEVIVTIPRVTDMDHYSSKMLQLALEHMDNPHSIRPDGGSQRTQTRYVEDIIANKVDVMWAATNQDLEDNMLPIRIPLLKGLLGHRIFLIQQNDQAKFDRIKTLEDLKKIKLGQGTVWADTQILEANELPVVKAQKYHSLLRMLDGGRFDAFPRGVQEPWTEVKLIDGLNLAVEQRIMLVYKMPCYFFVNKANSQLAKEIEQGLNRAIADGSFDQLFFNDPAIQNALNKANIKNRLVFHLDNPTLPKETPVDRAELWLDLKNLPASTAQTSLH